MSQPPEVEIEPVRESLWQRISVVWLIPLFAVLIAFGLAWQNYAEQGPYVEVYFNEATGIEAGETPVRYRDVVVGIVEDVGFTEDLSRVRVGLRLEPEVAPYVDDDAQFWIVSAEVGPRGVTGLETVLSGAFIEVLWDNNAEGLQAEFAGSDHAPLVRPGREGLKILLRATSGGGLVEGTPILYRGIEVGRIGRPVISEDGNYTIAEAFVEAPHDRLINSSTRFWDTSGFTFSIGADGAEIDFQSLAALLGGGVSFDTVISGGQPISDNQLFRLFADENSARSSVFADPDNETRVQVMTVFDSNASGLTVGAPVQLGGITVGEVVGLTGLIDEATFGDVNVRLLATLAIRPTRIGLEDDVGRDEVLDLLETQVQEGLRARLAAANILTGGLKIELTDIPNAVPASIDRAAIPFPIFPSVAAELDSGAATAEGILDRINSLPVEEVLASAINLMDNTSRLLGSSEIQAIPGEVNGLLQDTRNLVGSEEIQAIPNQIGATAEAIAEVAQDLQAIVDQFEEQQGIERLLAAVDAAGQTAEALTARTDGIPDLIDRITDLAADLDALDLAGVVNRTEALLASADELISSEDTLALPGQLNAALVEINTSLATFREEQGIETLVAAIEDAGNAAAALEQSMEQLPQFVDNITQLSERIRDLPLDAAVTEAAEFLESASALLETDGAAELPSSLNGALAEVEAVLGELRAGGVVENVNGALASASNAASAIETATETLPAVIQRLNAVLAQAGDTLASVGSESSLNAEARAALRDIQRAADAVASLARAIERRPNSLLTGR
ncbi:MlaD family protein [Aestuariibius insulae]|uniref:MlaD family protein n=1 Tax=Aestuariibius insulae TaxID=2058287 RepID=UPI00345EBAE4